MTDDLKQLVEEIRENPWPSEYTTAKWADRIEAARLSDEGAVPCAYLHRLPDGYWSLKVRSPAQMLALDALADETPLYARPTPPPAQESCEGWKRECDDADAILRHLGLDPERCRTEGGALNVGRIKTLLADTSSGWLMAVQKVAAEMLEAGGMWPGPTRKECLAWAKRLVPMPPAAAVCGTCGGGQFTCTCTQMTPTQPSAAQWLPISEAPKDGRQIIVSGGIAYWRERLNHWEGPSGWHTITGFDWPGRPIQWEVTHWMPFPPPPIAAAPDPGVK